MKEELKGDPTLVSGIILWFHFIPCLLLTGRLVGRRTYNWWKRSCKCAQKV